MSRLPYIKDDVKYDHVTSVLDYFTDPGLLDWKLKFGKAHCNMVSRNALKFGSRVDGLVEDYFKNGEYQLVKLDGDEVRSAMRAFDKFVLEHNPTFINSQGMGYEFIKVGLCSRTNLSNALMTDRTSSPSN